MSIFPKTVLLFDEDKKEKRSYMKHYYEPMNPPNLFNIYEEVQIIKETVDNLNLSLFTRELDKKRRIENTTNEQAITKSMLEKARVQTIGKKECCKVELHDRMFLNTQQEAKEILSYLENRENTWLERHNNLAKIGKEILLKQSELSRNLMEAKQDSRREHEEMQNNIISSIQIGCQLGIEAGRKENELNKDAIITGNQTIKVLIIEEESKHLERYSSTHEGLKTLHQENQEGLNMMAKLK
jgi:hypothetical protein